MRTQRNPYRRNPFSTLPNPLFAAFVLLILLLVIGGMIYQVVFYNSSGTATACVVSDKDRTTNANGGSDMRIYTDNCGVLSVEDNFFTKTAREAHGFSRGRDSATNRKP